MSDIRKMKAIAGYAASCHSYCEDYDLKSFIKDEKMIAAAAQMLLQISEKASRLTKMFRESRPEVPWQALMDMRDEIVRDATDFEPLVIWGLIENVLPEVERQLPAIIAETGRVQISRMTAPEEGTHCMIPTVDFVTKALTPVFERRRVSRAVLFGSVAKGTAHESSDVDLAVDSGMRGRLFFGLVGDVRAALGGRSVDVLDFRYIAQGSDIDREI